MEAAQTSQTWRVGTRSVKSEKRPFDDTLTDHRDGMAVNLDVARASPPAADAHWMLVITTRLVHTIRQRPVPGDQSARWAGRRIDSGEAA